MFIVEVPSEPNWLHVILIHFSVKNGFQHFKNKIDYAVGTTMLVVFK